MDDNSNTSSDPHRKRQIVSSGETKCTKMWMNEDSWSGYREANLINPLLFHPFLHSLQDEMRDCEDGERRGNERGEEKGEGRLGETTANR